MAHSYVLDTHAVVWYLEANPRLGAGARAALDDPSSKLYLPIVALAEACWIVEHGRTRIPSVPDLLADIDADERIVLCPLDRPILDGSLNLTSIPEMHDRLIVATALALSRTTPDLALVSRDVSITAGAPVPVIWDAPPGDQGDSTS